jgi:hypothetical protein
MNIEESIQQINELIEAWELNEACLNQTDIDAIKCLLKQNKELKQKYLNAVSDYETTMAEKEQLKKKLQENTETLLGRILELRGQQKEFINYLKNEKDRLAKECSQLYEDSLGKTRLVNEDIFNAINDVLQKYKDIIGDDK